MRRRVIMRVLRGAAAAAWPLDARAQKRETPVAGFLNSGAARQCAAAAVREGLSETAYVEGRNVAIEFRWAENKYADRLPALTADLVRRDFHRRKSEHSAIERK
jgi:putative ABC transport system substrate-binding protein